MSDVNVVTNWHPRPILSDFDLTAAERADLDYVDWDAVERGEDSWSGFRYRGSLYDLGQFERSTGTIASDWDGWQTQSAFDAVAVKYVSLYDDMLVVAHLHW